MRKQQHSIDGFVPRRASSQLGDRHIGGGSGEFQPRRSMELSSTISADATMARPAIGITRHEIDESLRGIDMESPEPTHRKRSRRARARARDKSLTKGRKRHIVRWIVIALLILGLGYLSFIAIKFISAGGSIFKGNIFDILQTQPLKQDANGRSNFLILGTSEDDPGHGGAYLTDSIMVVSVDQTKHNVYMFSVPRDLYVDYGMACNSGYQGKINEYFNCVNDNYNSDSAEQERLAQTQKFIGNIFGMDIQYGVHVNNTVIKEAVDAVGGVDVNIQGDGDVPYGVQPGSILDRNFDWRCNYTCYLVKYSPGVHHLDGEHALFLAMARGDTNPTYGLANSNFDREANQRKILLALKDKAASTGVLANPAKVTSLIDTLGKNLRTNIQTNEIRTIMDVARATKSSDIISLSLYDSDNMLVKPDSVGGASVVVPAAGTYDYTDIQAFIAQKLSKDPLVREGAKVSVYNSSSISGLAQDEADSLEHDGFNIATVGTAPEGTYDAVELYQIGKGMSATKAKLEQLYGVKVQTTPPPVSVTDGADFVVIVHKAVVSQ